MDGTGVVEHLSWSSDGSRLLIGVADPSADAASSAGSGLVGSRQPEPDPMVVRHDPEAGRRSLEIVDVITMSVTPLVLPGLNIWEASWCGDAAVLAIASPRADEGGWYHTAAYLIEFNPDAGDPQPAATLVYEPGDQLGVPSCSPSGRRRSVIEAVSSDRGMVLGDIVIIESGGSAIRHEIGIDVSEATWIDDEHLLFTGQRGIESLVGEIDPNNGVAKILWSTELSTGSKRAPEFSRAGDGSLIGIRDGYSKCYEIIRVNQDGVVDTLHAPAKQMNHDEILAAGTISEVCWTAQDGLEIAGLLISPDNRASGPPPMIVHLHGGPVTSWRNQWMMRNPFVPFLVSRGFAVLHPNPRGSSGRGQDYARQVVGDMNGKDALDITSGVDAMIERGLADPARIGVVGGSYGGNLSAWLVTQSDRFAAAVPLFPHTDFISFHHTSNIPDFDQLFLQSDLIETTEKHIARSPVTYAHSVRAAVLQIAGGEDRCCPSSQALEFHNAITKHGTPKESEMVIYAREGHGVREPRAQIDMCSRITWWFEKHLQASAEQA